MIVAEFDIDSAVLGLFVEFRTPAEGSLDYDTLKSEWPKYLLRTSDLDAAIRRLADRGDLRVDQDEQQVVLILTPQGFRRSRSHERSGPVNRSLWTRLRDTLWLEFRPVLNAQGRQQAQRRASDR